MSAVATSLPRAQNDRAVSALRSQAYQALAQGRQDEARALLQSLLSHAFDAEVASDLAAMALQSGDLVQAIHLARQVVAAQPDHTAAAFTLALSLSAIGSQGEALLLLRELTEGERGEAFRRQLPELAALAAAERARLEGGARKPASSATAAPSGLRQVFAPASNPGPSGEAPAQAEAAPSKYDFSHLVQPANQDVGGPIQDDEALLLYAMVRTMRVRRVLEIGGLSGYSARNFLQALSWDEHTAVYTVDLNPVASQAPNHYTLCKDVKALQPEDVHNQPLDLVFLDAHVLDAQMDMFVRLVNQGLINDDTILALHDTGLHPVKSAPWSYPIRDTDGVCGYVHQDVERKMVNLLRKDFGYDAFCAHMDVRRNDARLPFRHGLTLMKKFRELKV